MDVLRGIREIGNNPQSSPSYSHALTARGSADPLLARRAPPAADRATIPAPRNQFQGRERVPVRHQATRAGTKPDHSKNEKERDGQHPRKKRKRSALVFLHGHIPSQLHTAQGRRTTSPTMHSAGVTHKARRENVCSSLPASP